MNCLNLFENLPFHAHIGHFFYLCYFSQTWRVNLLDFVLLCRDGIKTNLANPHNLQALQVAAVKVVAVLMVIGEMALRKHSRQLSVTLLLLSLLRMFC